MKNMLWVFISIALPTTYVSMENYRKLSFDYQQIPMSSVSLSILTRGPWARMLTWVNNYKSLIQHFRLSVAMATNQNVEFVQLLYAWWRTTQQTFIKTLCQNTCSETAIKTNFHFSHYKSMETFKLSLQQKNMSNRYTKQSFCRS